MKLTKLFNENLTINKTIPLFNKYNKNEQQQKKTSNNNSGKKFEIEYKEELARKFVKEVKELAKKYNLNVFVVTDGASGISNSGNECVSYHRQKQIEWEKENGFDPNEDWSIKDSIEQAKQKNYSYSNATQHLEKPLPNIKQVLKNYGYEI